MFDDLLKELRRLEQGKKVEVTIQTDDDGFFDRKCPSGECQFEFKVHFEDWRDKVRDEEVFCPFCGHADKSSEWCTEEQHSHLKQIAIGHIQQSLGRAMKQDADRWNRQQPRNSFVSVTMSVNSAPQRISLPPAAADPMRLKITCAECACRYAVIGAAFFCPSCGHNAADLTFSQAIVGIRASLDALNDVRAAIPDSDTAENTVRLLIENGLQSATTAFQFNDMPKLSMLGSRPRLLRVAMLFKASLKGVTFGAGPPAKRTAHISTKMRQARSPNSSSNATSWPTVKDW